MAKVANGDICGIKALYAKTGDATSFYGWGGYEKGWDAVSRRWDWAGQQFKGGTVSYQNVTTFVTAELAYITDIETFKVRVDGMDRPTQWSNRVTHIFRLEHGEWRLFIAMQIVSRISTNPKNSAVGVAPSASLREYNGSA